MLTHFSIRQPARRAAARLFSSRPLAASAIAVVALTLALFYRESAREGVAAPAQQQAHDTVCVPWDEAASEAIVRLVRGKTDADLRQVADAVFRIRRARRNCEAGWTTLACRDYRAVIRSAPGAADRPHVEAPACPPAPSHADR